MKKLLWFIVIIVILLAAAALAAPYFINADSIKRMAIEQVQQKTGRTLAIGGDFRVKFFPIAGVTMEKVTLSNPPGYNDSQVFMSLKSLSIDVAVLPLLHRSVEVKSLVLDEPQINLQVNKDGVQNWVFAPAQKEAGAPTEAAATSQPPAAAALPGNVLLSDVEIKGGTISYSDDTAKAHWDIKKLNTKLSLNGFSSPFDLDGSAEWNGKTVGVKGTISTLQTLMNGQRTAIDADIKSDLLSIDAKGAIEKQTYTGKGSIKSSSLKDLMAWLQPAAKSIATPATLALDVTSDMQCNETSCNLSNATITLDKIQAKGTIKADFKDKPSIDIDLTTGKLDFNPFMAAAPHAALDGLFIAPAVADAGHWSDAPINLSGLEAVNLNANIKTDGILFQKVTIGKTSLKATIQNGKLTADIPDAELYSGKGTISVVADGAVTPAAYETHISLKGIQAEPLLKDAADMDRISGAADMQLAATSRGNSQHEIISALAGSGQIKLADGSFKGINLADMIRNIGTAFKANDSSQKTVISLMTGTFTIAQGVITNHDLSMKATGMDLTGQGTINLPAYTISYHLTPEVAGKAQNGKAAAGLGVPIIIEGSLDHPGFKPDVNGALQNALKNPQQLKDQLHNTERSLKGQLNNPSGGGLNNLKGLLKGLGGN